MTISRIFPSTLKKHREETGLSQEVLADRARLDRSYISDLEQAKKSPTLSTVEKLATVFGVSPVDLLSQPQPKLTVSSTTDYLVNVGSEIHLGSAKELSSFDTNFFLSVVQHAHAQI